MLDSIVTIVTCFSNILLGSLVLIRSPKRQASVAFFSTSLAISMWAISNHITGTTHVHLIYNVVFNRLAYLFAFLALACALWFSTVFPVPLRMSKRALLALSAAGCTVAILSLTSAVSGSVSQSPSGLRFSVGSLLLVYVACVLFFLALLVKNLIQAVKTGRGLVKQQAMYILVGFSLPTLLGLTTNAIIPSITSNWRLATFGPIFTILLVGTIGYTIVRHRLFDLQLAIARSLAYTLSLSAVVTAYTLIAFALLNIGFRTHASVAQSMALALFTALAALVFQPVKRSFDHMTNRIFYRDAYDPQKFFNDFNSAIASTILLDGLLRQTAETIGTHLKSKYCLVGVCDTSGKQRIGTTQARPPSAEQAAEVRHIASRLRQTVLLTDDIPPEHDSLRQKFIRHNVALIAKVGGNTHRAQAPGYIVLGPKKSGNPYTGQDIRVLEAVATGLVVAFQNALQFQEIQDFNVTLQSRVDDATSQLRQANKRLRMLDETKDVFISMASHQLRTPLTSIKGYVSMVLDGDVGRITNAQRDMLSQAFAASERMAYLIADLLDLSRLKSGKLVVEATPVNLAIVVQQEIGQLKETAASHTLTIAYDKPAHFPDLALDDTKMRQIIMNFLDNAIYYTPAGGRIRVRLIDHPATVELRVEDNGIGVPASEQSHLFTEFYRATNARKVRPDGTGIGLYMAKKAVAAHKGSIIFESKEGAGSTFGFRLPKDRRSARSRYVESVATAAATKSSLVS